MSDDTATTAAISTIISPPFIASVTPSPMILKILITIPITADTIPNATPRINILSIVKKPNPSILFWNLENIQAAPAMAAAIKVKKTGTFITSAHFNVPIIFSANPTTSAIRPIDIPKNKTLSIVKNPNPSISFLNLLNIQADVAIASDINVKKTGIFGTSPHFISEIDLTICFIPNDIITNTIDIAIAVKNCMNPIGLIFENI